MASTRGTRNARIERVVVSSESMAATDNYPELVEVGGGEQSYISIPSRDSISVQIVWVDGTHTDGSWQLQVSNDGTNWINEGSAVATTASATAATDAIKATSLCYEFARIVYTKGSNTAGTFSLYILARSI